MGDVVVNAGWVWIFDQTTNTHPQSLCECHHVLASCVNGVHTCVHACSIFFMQLSTFSKHTRNNIPNVSSMFHFFWCISFVWTSLQMSFISPHHSCSVKLISSPRSKPDVDPWPLTPPHVSGGIPTYLLSRPWITHSCKLLTSSLYRGWQLIQRPFNQLHFRMITFIQIRPNKKHQSWLIPLCQFPGTKIWSSFSSGHSNLYLAFLDRPNSFQQHCSLMCVRVVLRFCPYPSLCSRVWTPWGKIADADTDTDTDTQVEGRWWDGTWPNIWKVHN